MNECHERNKVDNRGSNRRGLVFEKWMRRRMGSVEVDDQVAGVDWACKKKADGGLGLGDVRIQPEVSQPAS